MNFFKKFTAQILFLTAVTIAGCSFKGGTEHTDEGSPSPWFLEPVQVVSSENAKDPVWGLPHKRNYRLKACVRDTATSLARIGETVKLTSDGQSQTEKLDPQGCFYWEHEISYRFLADETFGEKQWTVELAGVTQPLKLAFNPWREGASGLVDLEHTASGSLQKLAPADQREQAFRGLSLASDKSNLVTASVEANWLAPHQQGNNTLQPVDLRIGVAAEHETFDGRKSVPLTQGDLRFRAILLESKAGAEANPIAVLDAPAVTSLKQGWLEVKAVFKLNSTPETASEKILLFELTPTDSSAGLTPAYRRVVLNSSQKIPEIISESNFAQFQSKARREPGLEILMGPTAPATHPEPIPLLRVKSYKATAAAGTAVQSNWQANHLIEFEVCLEPNLTFYSASQQQLEDQAFQVRWNRERSTEKFLLKKVKNGCLKWIQSFEFPFAAVETYWPGHLEVQSTAAPFENLQMQIAYDVNPWRKDKVGWDTQELGQAPPNKDPQPAALVIENYTATYLGTWSHHIDAYMQLTILRKVLFQLKPKLNRPYSFDGGNSYKESIPENLRMNLAAVFSRGDDLSVDEGLQNRVSDPGFLGSFTTSGSESSADHFDGYGAVPIPFIHLPLWGARVQVALSLSAEGAAHAPMPASQLGLFNGTPLKNAQDTKLLFEESSNETVALPLPPIQKTELKYDKGKAYYVNHPWKKLPLVLFKEYLTKKYAPVEFSEDKLALPPEALNLETAEKIALGHCPDLSRFKPGSSELVSAHNCRLFPLKHFQVGGIRIAETVESEARFPKMVHGTSKLSATFFNEKKFSENEIKGHTFRSSFQAGLSTRLGYDKFGRGGTPLASFGVDNQHYATEEGTFSQDWRNGIRGSSEISLDRKTLTLTVFGNFRDCVVIRPMPTSISLWNAKVRVICTPAKSESVEESFYSFEDAAARSESVIQDPGDLRQRGWRKIIRGEDAFLAFDKLLADATRGFVLKKIESFHDGIETTLGGAMQDPLADDRIFQDGGFFPGISDFVEYSDIKWSEFEIRRRSEKMIRKLIAGGARETVAARYGYCYVAELATLVPHGDFKANAQSVEKWTKTLSESGTETRCMKFATDPRWDKRELGVGT